MLDLQGSSFIQKGFFWGEGGFLQDLVSRCPEVKELEAKCAFYISLSLLFTPAWSFSTHLQWQWIIINGVIIKKRNLNRSKDSRTNQFHVIDVFHLLVQISGARSAAVTEINTFLSFHSCFSMCSLPGPELSAKGSLTPTGSLGCI